MGIIPGGADGGMSLNSIRGMPVSIVHIPGGRLVLPTNGHGGSYLPFGPRSPSGSFNSRSGQSVACPPRAHAPAYSGQSLKSGNEETTIPTTPGALSTCPTRLLLTWEPACSSQRSSWIGVFILFWVVGHPLPQCSVRRGRRPYSRPPARRDCPISTAGMTAATSQALLSAQSAWSSPHSASGQTQRSARPWMNGPAAWDTASATVNTPRLAPLRRHLPSLVAGSGVYA